MTKTVAIFSAQYLPNIGGIECYTQNLSKALIDLGCKPIVVTTNAFGLNPLVTDPDGIQIVRLDCISLLKGRFPVAQNNAKNQELLGWLEDQKPDYVIVNARFYPQSLLGLEFAETHGIRAIVIDHGSAHLTLGSAILDIPLQSIEHAFTDAVKKYDADFYGVSQASATWLNHFGIEAQGVLNNSIDAAAFRKRESGRNFRNEFGIADDAFVVCFTGRYIPEKGVVALANAAKYLEEDGFEFFLAGDGPLRKTLESVQAKNLHLLGKTVPSDISALLQQSDVFCLPTRSEGFSTSLLEAAACGLPPVITNVGGVAELIPDARFGIVLQSADEAEIIAALEFLRDNPSICKKMGENIQQRVEQECSWNRTAQLALQACQKANERAPHISKASANQLQYDSETLRKLQLTELEILTAVDAFCKENSIQYFLDSGTALGATRHQGFIPWDDDVDVGMLREDYDRFIQLASDGLPEGYSLHTFDNTEGFAGFFAKVYKDGTAFDTEETLDAGCKQGIFIDIFPYDLASDDATECKRQSQTAYNWQRISYLYHSGKITVPIKGTLRHALRVGCIEAHEVIRHVMTREDIKKHFEQAKIPRVLPATKYQTFSWPFPHGLEKDILVPPVEREFEGHLFPCPAKTEEYLTIMYGPTWTELPPEKDRRNHAPINLDFGDGADTTKAGTTEK